MRVSAKIHITCGCDGLYNNTSVKLVAYCANVFFFFIKHFGSLQHMPSAMLELDEKTCVRHVAIIIYNFINIFGSISCGEVMSMFINTKCLLVLFCKSLTDYPAEIKTIEPCPTHNRTCNGYNGNCIGFDGNYNGVYWYVMDSIGGILNHFEKKKNAQNIKRNLCNGFTGKG